MTVGPDLDWLADDEGNLRPEAARAITQPPTPQGPQARPRVAWNAGHLGAAPRPWPRVNVPRLAIPPVWLPAVVIGAALVGVLTGRWTSSGSRSAEAVERRVAVAPDRFMDQPATAAVAPQPIVSHGFVNGINVNLRTGPGLFAPVLWKLTPGEAVRLGQEHGGWFAAETASGLRGYVFGALLRGAASVEGRPATVTQPMSAVVGGQAIDLRPGDRVLARLDQGGSATILLPSGFRLGVPQHALALLD